MCIVFSMIWKNYYKISNSYQSRHDHLVIKGKCREVIEKIKSLVEEEICCTPDAKTLKTALATTRHFCL